MPWVLQVTGKASEASAAAQDTAGDAAGRAQKLAGDTYDAAKGSAYDASASGHLAAKDAAAQAGSTWEKAKNVVSDVVDKVRYLAALPAEMQRSHAILLYLMHELQAASCAIFQRKVIFTIQHHSRVVVFIT